NLDIHSFPTRRSSDLPGSQFIYSLFSAQGAVDTGRQLDLITDKNQDKFFNTLVYPLYDDRDNVVGFARRRLDDNENFAKWTNPRSEEHTSELQSRENL